MRLDISAMQFLITACYVIIFGFIWRTLAAHWAESNKGKAMSFIF